MIIEIPLTPQQVELLTPFFGQKGTALLVAAIRPGGDGTWRLDVHALPGERRDSIRAACAGELKLKRPKKS